MTISPAKTAVFFTEDANWRVFGNNHNQKGSIVTNPIVSNAISLEVPFSEKVAMGALVSNNTLFKGSLNDFAGALSFRYSAKLSETNFLSFGVTGGLRQKSIQPDKLSFDAQYVPGYGYDATISSGENFTATSVTYPDFAFGTMWYYKNPESKITPYLGISSFHLNEPNESFFNVNSDDTKLKRLYVVDGGFNYKFSKKFDVDPAVLFGSQGNITQFEIGSMFGYKPIEDTKLKIAGLYRSGDAIVALAGLETGEFMLLFGYDINISKMNKVNTGGGFEISLCYTHKARKKVYKEEAVDKTSRSD